MKRDTCSTGCGEKRTGHGKYPAQWNVEWTLRHYDRRCRDAIVNSEGRERLEIFIEKSGSSEKAGKDGGTDKWSRWISVKTDGEYHVMREDQRHDYAPGGVARVRCQCEDGDMDICGLWPPIIGSCLGG